MIKINFLTEEAVSAVALESAGPGLSPMRQAVVFLGSLLASLALTGSLYWYWGRQVSQASQALAVEQREAARLAAIQAENQRFEQRVKEVEKRLETVRSLQNRRAGPVALMSALGEMVNRTTGLYLLTANAEGGRLVIQGQSDSVESIVNFIAVLRHAGSFTDVQFRQFFQDDQDKRMSFKFNLECVYQPPPGAPAASQPRAVATVSAPPPGGAPATALASASPTGGSQLGRTRTNGQ